MRDNMSSDTFYLPKADIYTALSTNLPEGTFIASTQPESLVQLPAVIFSIEDNSVRLDLDNDIVAQDIVAIVDIYAKTSVEASSLVASIEAILRGLGYKLTFNNEVPNIGSLVHINTRFKTLK